MIKPDRWIREWGRNGGVTPFEEGQVNAASYDVRVSDHWICPTRDPEEFRAPRVKLFPGEVVLASTLFMSLSRKIIRFVDTIDREQVTTPVRFL